MRKGNRPRTISFAVDDRARIPFAMIGVLLLVSSVAIVGVLENRPAPDPDIDPSLAMDRTAATSQTALRAATVQAADDVAREPVTVAADTELGKVLADGDPAVADRDEVFERYLKLRVYLEAQERLESVGQEIRGQTRTRASLESVDSVADAERAIDAVTLHVGGDDLDYGDPGGDHLESGTVAVTIDGLEITVERDGRAVAERTDDVTVTVGTMLFELHDRTNEYERQLNMGFGESAAYEGFGEYFGARLYPLAWERGYAQYEGEPVSEVIANRHVETLGNDAIFATQRKVFGNDDPYSDETLSRAYACMLAQDARGIYDTPDGGSSSVEHVLKHVDEDSFCDGLDYMYDDIGTDIDDLYDPPEWTELASQNDYLTETETIDLDDVSSTVFGELVYEGEVDRAVDRIYTADVSVDSDVETAVFPTDTEDDSNTDLKSFSVEVTDRDRLVDADETGKERELYKFDIHFEGIFERGSGEDFDEAIVVYDTTIVIEAEHSPDHSVIQRGIEYDYKNGPAISPDTIFDHNYFEVPEYAVEEVLVGVDDARKADIQLEEYFEANHDSIVENDDILDEGDFIDEVTEHEDGWTVRPEPSDREQLRGWLIGELSNLKEGTSDVHISPQRHELFEEDEPLGPLLSQIEDDDEWVYSQQNLDDDLYANVPDKVRAELYLEYMERLRDRVEEANDRHEEIVHEFDDELTTHMNSGIGATTNFAVGQFDDDPDRSPIGLPEYPVLNDVEISPDGAPTYLTLERVERAQSPPVADPDEGFAPMASSTDDIYGVPFEDATDRVELQTAGEVLEAGNATDSLSSDSNWDSGSTDALRSELEAWVDDFAIEAGAYGAQPFQGISQHAVTDEINEEIEALGPVERQVIQLGEGEDTLDRIAENVSREFTVPKQSEYEYRRPSFRQHLENSIRHGLDASIGDQGTVSSNVITTHTTNLGEAVRTELDNAEDDVIDERLDHISNNSLDDLSLTTTEEPWLESSMENSEFAPNRVPSGTPMSDIPMWDVLTVNIWHIDVHGEYARFTTSAETTNPSTTRSMGYVREAGNVSLEIDGNEKLVGQTEKIQFESQLSVPIAVPSDGLGVGDRTGNRLDCSETYAEVGPIDDEGAFANCAGNS